MANSILSPAAESMVNLINNFGCISKKQAELLWKERAQRIASAMIQKNLIKEREETYVPIVKPMPDKLMIDCLWVALNKAKKEDGSYDMDALSMAMQNRPVYIGMISNNTFYNIVGINSDNVSSVVMFLVDRYNKNQNTEDGLEYIFVVRKEELIDEILSLKPSLPYRIVFLEGDGPTGPKIRYLKKQA